MCKHIKKVWNSQPVIFARNSLKHSFSLWVSLNTSQNSEAKACPRVSFLIRLQVSGGYFCCLNSASVVACRFSVKQVLLKISQQIYRKTCVSSLFFNEVAVPRPATLLKSRLKYRLWHRCFFVNFALLLITSILKSTPGRLLMMIFNFVSIEALKWIILIYFSVKYRSSLWQASQRRLALLKGFGKFRGNHLWWVSALEKLVSWSLELD